MVRFILALVALIAPLFAALPAAAATRAYSVTDYDRVVVEGPYQVRVILGSASAATAEGSQGALDRLAVDVNGQTLRIRRNRNFWGGSPTAQEGVATITLATRSLRSIRVIGPGRVEANRAEGLRVDLIVEGSGELRVAALRADNLSIGLAGAGRLQLAGSAGVVVADLQGTGDLDAAALRADNVTLTTTTTGTVRLQSTRTANVNALGLGTVEIAGRAACTLRGPNAELVACGAAHPR